MGCPPSSNLPWPPCARGAAESTATSDSLGTLRPARPCRSCRRRRACRSSPGRPGSSRRPARSSRPGCRPRGRRPSPTVVNFGMSSTVEASTPGPIRAPNIRSHTGVSALAYSGNSQVRASSRTRRVAPDPHAGAGPDPGGTRLPCRAPRARTSAQISNDQRGVADERRKRDPRQRTTNRVAQPVRRRPRTGRRDEGAERARQKAGSAAIRAAMAPYRPSHACSVLAVRPVGASCPGPRASARRRSAGEPAQNSPAGTTPFASEPGATSASLPTQAPGLSVQRAPTRARAPTSTIRRGWCHRRASDPSGRPRVDGRAAFRA